MKLSDFLDDKSIITNLRTRDKISALREITGILYKDGKIMDKPPPSEE
jgi:mannitol/fructose-specific phosphotransferase system IIA component (Ntr-type)